MKISFGDVCSRCRQALGELEPFLTEQPENLNLITDLALTNALLGDKAAGQPDRSGYGHGAGSNRRAAWSRLT
jgi:hypothetical protein